jgi:hypothetical protein
LHTRFSVGLASSVVVVVVDISLATFLGVQLSLLLPLSRPFLLLLILLFQCLLVRSGLCIGRLLHL